MFIHSIQTRAALIAAVLLLAACSKRAPPQEPIRAVKVVTVGLAPLTAGTEFAGEVRARVESRLGFRVGGKIVRRQVEPGQRVKAGQVLAQLDPQDYALAAQAARAQVAAAQSSHDLAAADFKRYQDLRARNFISAAELERREASLKGAAAQLAQAQAQSSAQGNQTSYTTLVADAAGVVTAVDGEPGQVVAAGAPVVRLAQDGPRDVVFAVPEDQVAQIRTGTLVEVRAWNNATRTKGAVREVAASADPVTRTFGVKVALGAQDTSALGSTVTVLLPGSGRDAAPVMKLPTSALRQDGKATAVWVLDKPSMTVRLQPVQIASVDGNDVVLAGGLQPGMQVVVAGVHVLAPGQKVTIFKQNEALAPVDTAQPATNSIVDSTRPGVAPTIATPALAASATPAPAGK
ncbi:MAG: efflux RND transporter periplasmic adaptor subunit [Rhodoferax sp.]|uniref:efflux RND transporter periplasmic adaptor subunit n=1 Tax=Rhodoferax sp. TaxID=50421 RepID=UPI001400871F|nr:efflux RND transporter periplasmic adaptor subunit [Rhodoferax sp.]NDP38826.1 efflux RND transporter periplasmic adaptor subunit [Rhodoferax sp.]